MNELMLKIENISKEYKLGVIGGTTLRDELQRFVARIQHKEDPTLKIGEERINEKGKFMALSDISFEAKAGDAIGIVGHNGAGKSTLLKLITRITAPTSGRILLNGRVASMLEVGTGFHAELTGRENIYVNGAMLGMSKKEIDSKMDDIIDFSECRQFIDTPVKRYSSGMYVKLAFSVAAHLDSEIVIMDEVLAVGDVSFQNKCINKMRDIAASGRTVLYVSHNMATIRRLCNRCICLDKGKLVYDGSVEEGIDYYIKNKLDDFKVENSLLTMKRHGVITGDLKFSKLVLSHMKSNHLNTGENIKCTLFWVSRKPLANIKIRIHFYTLESQGVGYCESEMFKCKEGTSESEILIPTDQLMPGRFTLTIMAINVDSMGNEIRHDCINNIWNFEIIQAMEDTTFHNWNSVWGYVRFKPIEIYQIN